MKKTFIIGITGISGSGKTTIGMNLKEILKNVRIVRVDDYWKERKRIPKSFEKWREWEWPLSINFEKLHKNLIQLRDKKKYKFIIVEGNLLFYYKKIRDIIDLKVYLKIPNKLLIDRRIKKFGVGDNQEKYSKEIVIKEYKKYGKSAKKYADLSFKGTEPLNNITKKIIKKLKTRNII